MTYPRYQQIQVEQTPYYHLVSRCVRRSFLCGFDKVTGQSYEHRKDWVEKRLIYLTKVFSIGVMAYAVMSNHTHLVVYIDKQKCDELTDIDVIQKWHMVSKGNEQSREFARTGLYPKDESERIHLNDYIYIIKDRLSDVSWFMKLLNEYIARRANKEDECTGHFWEGRFKSQPLLDSAAVLSCMAYVDLNPLRAGITTEPFVAPFTSLNRRLLAEQNNMQPRFLIPFAHRTTKDTGIHLKLSFTDYTKLINDTANRDLKKVPRDLDKVSSQVISDVGLHEDGWFKLTTSFESLFPTAVGKAEKLKQYMKATERDRVRGESHSYSVYQQSDFKPH
ncbi:MAG: transposase [Glaciecola sp.]